MFQPIDISALEAMTVRSHRIAAMIHARAVQAYCAAFGRQAQAGDHLDMCVIHNSIVSFDQGQPWREVDYSQMRKAAWLIERSFEPNRIVHAWYNRVTRVQS